MKKLVLQNKLYISGALLGGLAGFLYWKFIGCTTGACLITGKPLNSIFYFGVMGALFLGIFKKEKHGNGGK